MEDDPHKSLGSNITETKPRTDHYTFLKEKLELKLINLHKTIVQDYLLQQIILPSFQFHFYLHCVHKTHLDVHDGMAR